MNVELHIGEVVVIGVDLEPGSEAVLRRTLQRELTALLSTQGPQAQLLERGHVQQLTVGDIALPPSPASASNLGRAMSGAVHEGLVR